MRTRASSWRPALALGLTGLVLVLAGASAPVGGAARGDEAVRLVKIHYHAHNGARRAAFVVLPRWYGRHRHPPIPLVISPHGRGVSARANARRWGRLPAEGGFAVVSPEGQGRRLTRFSWGYRGQIADLARMPEIVRRSRPWLHIDGRRVYAVGGSMGGQESLLLLARHPRLLAGVAVFDSVIDLALQYRRFSRLACRKRCRREWDGSLANVLRAHAREEVGGGPWRARRAYARRSPITYANRIARSCVPLQLWWSVKDRIVVGQQDQSGRLFNLIKRLNPDAPVQAFVGSWNHSAAMDAKTRLPLALASLGLLPEPLFEETRYLRVVPPPKTSRWCGP